jgi:hypothetical protein
VKIGEGSSGPGVQGRWADSRKCGKGGDVLEHGRKRVGRKVERDSGRHLFMAARWHDKKEKGAGGSEVGAAWRAGTRKREPPPGAAGDNSGSRHQSPTGGCGRCHCRATGEGGGAQVALVRTADRRDRAATGPGGQRRGGGGRGESEAAHWDPAGSGRGWEESGAGAHGLT